MFILSQVSTYEEKERVRYFHDDDTLSLSDLVKNEKMGTAENQNKHFMKMTSKVRYIPRIPLNFGKLVTQSTMIYFSDTASSL